MQIGMIIIACRDVVKTLTSGLLSCIGGVCSRQLNSEPSAVWESWATAVIEWSPVALPRAAPTAVRTIPYACSTPGTTAHALRSSAWSRQMKGLGVGAEFRACTDDPDGVRPLLVRGCQVAAALDLCPWSRGDHLCAKPQQATVGREALFAGIPLSSDDRRNRLQHSLCRYSTKEVSIHGPASANMAPAATNFGTNDKVASLI